MWAYLCYSHFKVFLRDMDPSFPQGIHTSLCTNTLKYQRNKNVMPGVGPRISEGGGGKLYTLVTFNAIGTEGEYSTSGLSQGVQGHAP